MPRTCRWDGVGNRILFALASPAGPGFDLVQLSDGALQLGVNQWPDGSPAMSTAGLITADSALGAENWVFFAVTYDGTQPAGNVSWYFGKGDQEAQPDSSNDYDRGPILQSGALTVGNFGTVVGARDETGPASGSRCFRGLMDELNVFNKVLTLAEIQALQKTSAGVPVTAPDINIALQGQEIVLSWETTGNFKLQSRADLSQGSSTGENHAPTVDGNKKDRTIAGERPRPILPAHEPIIRPCPSIGRAGLLGPVRPFCCRQTAVTIVDCNQNHVTLLHQSPVPNPEAFQ